MARAGTAHERRAEHPILPTPLLMNRAVGPAILGSALFGVGFLSLDTYVPLYVQGGRGGDATAAASVVTPVMLTWALSNMLSAPLLVRWGFRTTATVGAALIVVGMAGLFCGAYFQWPRASMVGRLSSPVERSGKNSRIYSSAMPVDSKLSSPAPPSVTRTIPGVTRVRP